MKRIKSVVLIAISFLFILMFLAFLLLDESDYQKALVWGLQQSTNYQIKTVDDISISLAMQPIIEVENLNLETKLGEPFLMVDKLSIQFSLLSLLSSDLDIQKLIVHSGTLTLNQKSKTESNASIPDIELLALTDISISCFCANDELITIDIEKLEANNGKLHKEITGLGKVENQAFKITSKIVPQKSNATQAKGSTISTQLTFSQSTINFDGTLDDPKNLRGFNMKVSGNTKNLAEISKYLPYKIPTLGKASLSAHLKGDIDDFQASELLVTIKDQHDLDLTISGEIKEFEYDKNNAKADANLTFKEDDLKAISFVGNIIKTEKDIRFDGDISIDKTPFKSDLTLSYKTSPSMLSGKLTANKLDINTLSLRDKSKNDDAQKSRKDTKLRVELFKTLDMDILISADAITGKRFSLDKTEINLLSQSGLLSLKPTTLVLNQVPVQIEASIQTLEEPPRVMLDVQAHHIEISKLSKTSDNQPTVEGDLTFHLDVEGTGATIGEVLKSMDGQLTTVLDDGIIHQPGLQMLSIDFFGWLFEKIIHKEHTTINCAINQNLIENGKINVKVLQIESPDMEIRGAGQIKLYSEHVDLLLYADDKSFLKPSVPIEIKGDLYHPNVEIRPSIGSLTSLSMSVIPHLFVADVVTTKFMNIFGLGDKETLCK